MSFDDAHAIGLVHEVWDETRLAGKSFADAVQEYARQFTPPHKASRAVGRIKRAVQSGAEMSFGDGLALERELQQLLFESVDASEGIAANLEKRKPSFTGN
jgi:enoyl-CoA hydratase